MSKFHYDNVSCSNCGQDFGPGEQGRIERDQYRKEI